MLLGTLIEAFVGRRGGAECSISPDISKGLLLVGMEDMLP